MSIILGALSKLFNEPFFMFFRQLFFKKFFKSKDFGEFFNGLKSNCLIFYTILNYKCKLGRKMKTKSILKVVLMVFICMIFPNVAEAETLIGEPSINCGQYFEIFANKTNAVANGTDSIILSLKVHIDGCPGGGGPVFDRLSFSSDGQGNTFTPDILDLGNAGSPDFYSQVNDKTFTTNFKSTVAGTKNLHLLGNSYLNPPHLYDAVIDSFTDNSLMRVTFSAPPVATATSTPRVTQRVTPTSIPTLTTAPSNLPPSIPVLEKLKVGNVEHAIDKISENKLKQEEKKIFSGKTIPEGIVHLYFHSSPFEDTTIADKDGNWSYELKKDIGAGDHTLQIAVTDPKTNLTSEKSKAVKFAIAGVATTSTPEVKNSQSMFTNPILLGSVSLVLIGLVIDGVFGAKQMKKKKSTPKQENDASH